MKLFLVLLSALLLTACPSPTSNPGTKSGHLVSASVSGAKGLFLAGSSVSQSRSVMGRSLVTGTAANLQQITASGQPGTVTFTDSNNQPVSVNVTQASQLSANWILFSYTSSEGNATASMNLSTGAVTTISPVPDNWGLIFVRGNAAYYEQGGGIWQTDLGNGVGAEISTGSATWNSNTHLQSGNSSWSSSTWIYADSRNIYAFFATNSGEVQASSISGQIADFGSSSPAWSFIQDIPGSAAADSHFWPIVDPATGNLFLLQNYDIPSGAPDGHSIGVGLEIVAVTLDPTTPGVITIGTTALQTSTVGAAVYGSTNIAGKTDGTKTIFSNGPQTWQVSFSAGSPVLTSWDSSAVPVVNNGIVGQVLNWQWASGAIFAGPTSAVPGVSLATLNADGSVTDPEIVPDAVTSWSVVGGVLFYTTAQGTFSAAVNTATASIATPVPYTGGQVVGVTE